jgi:Protein of unknown function (DUF1524)
MLLGGLLGLAAVGAAGCAALDAGTVAGPTASGGPPVAVRPADGTAAQRELAQLTVGEPRPGGYQRTRDFGPAWSFDFDHNGCRQRDDVLRRDLTQVRLQGRCTVVAGVLADPYTGRTVVFRKAAADQVQIDHVYPLAAAWAHGAREWQASQRLRLANDPANLLATIGSVNSSKGDGTPAQWQPRSAFRCAYAVRYVDVASRYRLTISAADRRALTGMLATCPRAR